MLSALFGLFLMSRRAFRIVFCTVAFCFVALSLVSDPFALFTANTLSAGSAAHAQTTQVKPLSANDVSWLFPNPTSFDDLISMADLKARGRPVWSNAAFRQLLNIARGP